MKTEINWNDAHTLKKLRQKDTGMITVFVREFQPSVFRICLGFIHHREDAEDLTQEVFMEIFKNIGSFKNECRLSTWIYRICYTRALNMIKRNKWQKWMQSFDSVLGVSPSMVSETDDSYENKEEQKALHAAIDRLPTRQKTAFVLHYYERQKYAEIAEIMSLSVSSVESLLFRARKNLQKELLLQTRN